MTRICTLSRKVRDYNLIVVEVAQQLDVDMVSPWFIRSML